MPDYVIVSNLDALDDFLTHLTSRHGRRHSNEIEDALDELVYLRKRSADAHHPRIDKLTMDFEALIRMAA